MNRKRLYPTQVIAHRGGAGLWPENTLFALQHADDLGVNFSEIDVRMTKDNVLVLMHDDSVDRTTNGSGLIKSLTLAELKNLDAGYRWTNDQGKTFPYRNQNIKIPTLEEIFIHFPKKIINLDIKQYDSLVLEQIKMLINRHDMNQYVRLVIYKHCGAKRLRALFPESNVGASDIEIRAFFLLSQLHLSRFYLLKADFLEASFSFVNYSLINAAYKQKKHVYVWTVNKVCDMRRFLAMRPTGIVTDYPDQLLSLMK